MLKVRKTGNGLQAVEITLDIFQLQAIAGWAQSLSLMMNVKTEKTPDSIKSKIVSDDMILRRKMVSLSKSFDSHSDDGKTNMIVIDMIMAFLTKVSVDAPSKAEVIGSLTDPVERVHDES